MRDNSLGFMGEENPLNYLLQTCGGHEPVPGWATVTSAAPLRVRKDHEDNALDVTPETLVGGLAEGDRVLLAEWAGQPVILGRAGGGGGQPYAMAAGTVVITPSGTPSSAPVTFPVGRFTAPPVVVASRVSVHSHFAYPGATITTSGFEMFMRRLDGAAPNSSLVVHWQAVQMTPTSAEG